MIPLIVSFLLGIAAACGLAAGDVLSPGWSVTVGALTFVVLQMLIGLFFQRRVKAAMKEIQNVLVAGQKKLEEKTRRWQLRPPGSYQAAQAEILRDTKAFVADALALTEKLHAFDLWVPLMKRQIATAQFQLYWNIGEFKKADEVMEKAIFADPNTAAMKLARLYMKGASVDDMRKVYEKAVRRLRYNQNVVLAAAWSWILVQKNDVDGAFKALLKALENSDNEVLKRNREELANNRVAHFNNSGLGDQWYALRLEEPRMPRMRQHGPRC